jgi:FAD/FMN-containing dehydrogenase
MVWIIILILASLVAFGTSGLFIYGAYHMLRNPNLTAMDALPFNPDGMKGTLSEAVVADEEESGLSRKLRERLSRVLRGDVVDDSATLLQMSRDTSVFMRRPKVVVYPKDADDVASLVKEVAAMKADGQDVSVTARSAGTDMGGGPLTNSILAVFTKYMTQVREIKETADGGYAITEPGVYYRDFEKETLAHGDLMLQSYPASRELAAMGGIVNNNSGGERTLEFGKTADYIESIDLVLSDGSQATFGELSPVQLDEKKQLQTLEGKIYREMDELLTTHSAKIAAAKPQVSKNSAGYALWDVKDPSKKTFNLAKLICGAQGTLGLMTSAKLRLVKDQGSRSMIVAFLKESDMPKLPQIVHAVMPHNPESFESFDNHTLSLAIRFLPSLLMQMGFARAARLGFSFLPEAGLVLTGGAPHLILMAEFSEDTHEAALNAAQAALASLSPFGLRTRILNDERASEKYWIVRRESFALLRKHSKGLYATPFIDDFVVPVDTYPQFLPELDMLLNAYKEYFIYTVAGHIGNGNFHIIPLMDLSKPEVRNVILELAPKVYDLVHKYKGTTTGEHNDGIIRTPYLKEFFGDEVYGLFEKTKKIFDPNGIFNPGKKVGGTFKDIERDMITQTS